MNSIQKIKESLPDGSGIDCKWYFNLIKNNTVLRARNSFHCMNEHGYYDGYADFTLLIPIESPIDFKLQFNGSTAQYKNRKYMLRDMLEDTVFYALK